ncbi:MAG: aminoacyl-tRNA hydrolase [Acidimicrobiales bacterium]
MRHGDRRGTPADLLVVGLGNPGEEYARTRHNAGAWVVEEIVERHGERLRRARRVPALVAELRVDQQRLVVAVPVTYMNDSGRAVGPLVRRHGIDDLAQLVVVHDDIDLPVGRMKVKLGGGLAGHKGLRSIRSHIHSDGFTRIRIGVGRPDHTPHGGDHVLRRPSRAERTELDAIVARAADAVEDLLSGDPQATMNRFNAPS